MVWYGYLFRYDIHLTHIFKILYQHVTQHLEFFPLNLSLHNLKTLVQVARMSDIHLNSVQHRKDEEGYIISWLDINVTGQTDEFFNDVLKVC
jgi:hypothetical protein